MWVGKIRVCDPLQSHSISKSQTARMIRELVILTVIPFHLIFAEAKNVQGDITKALQNIKDMESDLLRFYKQWDSLSKGIAAQGTRKALESCARDHESNCTAEKRQALSKCVASTSKTIHDEVVKIYDDKIRVPWEREFQALRKVLENPLAHESEIKRTIWTVHQDTFSETSVRYRFYTSLVNFQLPYVAPGLHPLDKVYQLCLEQQFP